MLDKCAVTTYPLHELIASRSSPLAFSSQPVESEKLGSLIEAARWAPSCYNEQPWVFLIGTSAEAEGFERLASCLLPGNAWAKKAPILMLSVAKLAFELNGAANRHALHDVGLAVENLVLQAEALDLSTHQIGGFDAELARDVLGIPEGFEPVTMIAIGYQGSPDELDEQLRDRELSARSRKGISSFVFGARWGTPADSLGTGQ